MTKEQILAAIAQATGVVDIDPDAGFVAKVKETNSGQYVTFWVGTQAQYNAIGEKATNCLYIITDDTSKDDFEKTVKTLLAACETANVTAAKALDSAIVKIEENMVTVETAATHSMTIDGIKSKFYIVEVVDMGGENDGTEPETKRYSMALDYHQVSSGKRYYFPGTSVAIFGSVSSQQATISIDTDITDGRWRICRFVGYY